MRTCLSLILAGCCFGFVAPAGASPWPRFRGPNGTGIAADKDIPVTFSAQNGILWKTAVPGLGNSSPVVWGDHVFVQSTTVDGKERMLLCLGAADGKVLWSRSVPGARARTHGNNTLASSTPATDGERVYTVFWDGKDLAMHAYDFKGNPVWNRSLGPLSSQHGAGNSPIVYEDKIIFANDQDGSSTLLALEAKTGKPLWQAPRRAYRLCYSTPFLLQRPGESAELIVASTAGVSGYNPQTGTETWSWTWTFAGKPLRTVGSPVALPNMVFATSGDGSGERHMAAVTLNGKDNKASLAWENKKTLPYVPTMIPLGEHLYFVNDHGFAGCCLARTGELVWTERLGGNVTASPVLIDGKVYAVGEDGTVYVFTAATTFKLLGKSSLGEPVRASPAVADNRLFIRSRETLFCIAKPAK